MVSLEIAHECLKGATSLRPAKALIPDARPPEAQIPGNFSAMLLLRQNSPWSRGSDGFPHVLYTVITWAITLEGGLPDSRIGRFFML
jgi:hypothetical protein